MTYERFLFITASINIFSSSCAYKTWQSSEHWSISTFTSVASFQWHLLVCICTHIHTHTHIYTYIYILNYYALPENARVVSLLHGCIKRQSVVLGASSATSQRVAIFFTSAISQFWTLIAELIRHLRRSSSAPRGSFPRALLVVSSASSVKCQGSHVRNVHRARVRVAYVRWLLIRETLPRWRARATLMSRKLRQRYYGQTVGPTSGLDTPHRYTVVTVNVIDLSVSPSSAPVKLARLSLSLQLRAYGNENGRVWRRRSIDGSGINDVVSHCLTGYRIMSRRVNGKLYKYQMLHRIIAASFIYYVYKTLITDFPLSENPDLSSDRITRGSWDCESTKNL